MKLLRIKDSLKYNDKLLAVTETNENVTDFDLCVFDEFAECDHPGKIATIIPISSGGKDWGLYYWLDLIGSLPSRT